ncbi:hypothetical protein GGR57DRAFT_100467 [Xylariaceae sp. FL1272]|nr:hypothetical protein GGR57DRAFT_100467 [Xylariaceae sp. FL1272]
MAEWKSDIVKDGKDHHTPSTVIELGDVSPNVARWWAAILAPGRGWETGMHRGRLNLHSPWSLSLDSKARFILSGTENLSDEFFRSSPASFAEAVAYIEEYVSLHEANRQSQMAFATVLLLPLPNIDRGKIILPLPQASKRKLVSTSATRSHIWGEDVHQLDRLLILSCNEFGLKSLLGSIFYEPGMPSNVWGAWLQGSYAVLKSGPAQDPHILGSMFFNRSPHLACIWLGAILTGVHIRMLRQSAGLVSGISINLEEGAWTGTLLSFNQDLSNSGARNDVDPQS